MIWLTWRQFRMPAYITAAALAVLGILLAITGPHLHHQYQDFAKQLASCNLNNTCDEVSGFKVSFLDKLLENQLILAVLPLVLGAFWGAPLVARELEAGTWRMAWTQGVTRNRWLAIKLAVVGVSTVAATGLLILMESLWLAPVDRMDMDRFDPSQFGDRGIVPLAYALFAFAFAVAAGTLIRKTLPAIASTAVAFIAARIAMTDGLRPHLLPAKRLVTALADQGIGFRLQGGSVSVVGNGPHASNTLVLSSKIIDASGNAPTSDFIKSICPGIGDPPALGSAGPQRVKLGIGGKPPEIQSCIQQISLKFHEVSTYQPANRYWTFQIMESAIFVLLAVGLFALTFWWTRKRLA